MAPRKTILDYDIPDFDTYMPGQLGDQMDYVSNTFNLDPELYQRQIRAESGFNPEAVSPRGAKGLLQLMPETAGDLGVTDPFDQEQNLLGGGLYMRQLLDRYEGNYPLALAAHNAGMGNVDKYGGIPPFQETQNYVKNILGKELPQSTNVASSGYSKLPEPSPLRSQNYDQLSREIAALQGNQADALKGMNTSGKVEDNDAIAMALTAIIPTLLGMGIAGKQGGAIGAEAGAAGAMVGLKGIQANTDTANANNRLIYQNASQQLAQRQSQQQSAQDSIADRTERNAELEYITGHRKATAATQSYTEESSNILSRVMRGDPTVTTEDEAIVRQQPGGGRALENAYKIFNSKDLGQSRIDIQQKSVDDRREQNQESNRQGQSRIDIQQKSVDDRRELGDANLQFRSNQSEQQNALEREKMEQNQEQRKFTNEQANRRLDQTDERNKSYSDMVANSKQAQKDRLALSTAIAGRLSGATEGEISGKSIAMQNYKELAQMVQNRDIDAPRISQVLGQVNEEYALKRTDKFDASEWTGIFDRLAAKAGITPNSYDFQVLERMKQIGRGNAIAQRGVATNEDALAEISFVSIKAGQSIPEYLANLARQAESKRRELLSILTVAKTNGYSKAQVFMDEYLQPGTNIGGDDGSAAAPTEGEVRSKMVNGARVDYVRQGGKWVAR